MPEIAEYGKKKQKKTGRHVQYYCIVIIQYHLEESQSINRQACTCRSFIYHNYPKYSHPLSPYPTNIMKTSLFKYIENFTTKNWKFSDKNSDIFLYFCSKHRLWVLLEPPQRGGSKEYPQSMFLSRNKKIMYTPVNPSFRVEGGQQYIGMFSWWRSEQALFTNWRCA